MLYKGEPIYEDSAQLRDDLAAKKILTVIVADELAEQEKRTAGWVDLPDLMVKRHTLHAKK